MNADASSPVAAGVLERLHNARGFVFDLDGTLVLGDKRNAGLQPLPGAIEFTRELARRGTPFAILTNGTVRTPEQYAGKLRALGFALEDRSMLTPASVVGCWCWAGRGSRCR
jgi:ribonucleotide monophosphatase NagD (HAD superfamily)